MFFSISAANKNEFDSDQTEMFNLKILKYQNCFFLIKTGDGAVLSSFYPSFSNS